VDNRNLTKEQLTALDESIRMIDEVLSHIDSKSYPEAVKTLHNARNKVNAVATGERTELGQMIKPLH
jgi:hypothetical protein